MATIGIFDTGFGGRYVAEQLKLKRPHDTYLVVDDRAHLPYGSRTPQEIFELTDAAIEPLLEHVDVMVIACNTATTLAIDRLRQAHPTVRFVGFEPMVKTAAELTKTGKIAILATPATLNSQRYDDLKQQWAQDCEVWEPDCSDWAKKIEDGVFDTQQAVRVAQQAAERGVDIISLACTHYLYLKKDIQAAAGAGVRIIEPLEAVNRQIDRVLAKPALQQ